MLVFNCSVCSDFNGCSTCELWTKHLLQDSHQEKVKKTISNWDVELNTRAVVVTGFSPLRKRITFPPFLRYVANHVIVVDFYFCNKRKYCVVLIINKNKAKLFMEKSGSFNKSNSLSMRLKSTFTTEDWDNLHGEHEEDVFIRHAALCESMGKLGSLDEQFHFFLSKQPFTNEMRTVHKSITEDVISILRNDCSNLKVFPYGNKYAYPQWGDSIFNAVVLSTEDGKGNLYNEKQYARLLSKMLHDYKVKGGTAFSDAIVNRNRTSVKCEHTLSQITCNFTHNLRFGIHQFRLLTFLEQYDLRVQPLSVFICYWSTYYFDLTNNETSDSTDPFILLVLFFLICRKIIPPIILLHHSPKSIFNLNGEVDDTIYSDIVQELRLISGRKPPLEIDVDSGKPTAAYMLKLACDFFHFYETVDFDKNVLSVPLGKFIEKKAFEDNPQFPSTLLPYNFKSCVSAVQDWVNSPLSIQDPCNVYDNVSEGFSQETVDRFVKLCGLTRKALESLLTDLDNTPNFNPQFMEICNPNFFSQDVDEEQNQNCNAVEEVDMLPLSDSEFPQRKKKDSKGNQSLVLTIDKDYRIHVFPTIRRLAQESECKVNFRDVANALWYSLIEEMLDCVWTDGFACKVTKKMTEAEDDQNGVSEPKRRKLESENLIDQKLEEMESENLIEQKLKEMESKEFVQHRTYFVESKYNVWRSRNNPLNSESTKGEHPMVIQRKLTEAKMAKKKLETRTIFECHVEFGSRNETPRAKLEIRNTPPKRKSKAQKHRRHFRDADALELLNCLKLLSRHYLRLNVRKWALNTRRL